MYKIKFGDTVYYNDAVNDEFSGIERPEFSVDGNFKFTRNGTFYRIAKFIVYRVFVTPFAFAYCRLKFGMKVIGKHKLDDASETGYFLFGNHTQVPGDGFIPNVITFPTETHVIVNPDNLALAGTRTLMQMLGAIPTPTGISGFSGFNSALSEHISKHRCIVVYPEAHIWPYATCIRPFPATSFRYPVKENVPSFCFTVTYRKSKRGKPRIVTYVDGPFFGEGERLKDRQTDLRNKIYETMKSHADAEDNYKFISYVQNQDNDVSE